MKNHPTLLCFMASIFLPKCRSVMAFLRKWNESKGSKKGIYFALGGNNGPSLEAFWIGIYPTKNRTNKYNIFIYILDSY